MVTATILLLLLGVAAAQVQVIPFKHPPYNNEPPSRKSNHPPLRSRTERVLQAVSVGTLLRDMDNDTTTTVIGLRGENEENPAEGNNMVERAVQLLQRLNDRITALQTLDEQQLRRLETLEYRLTKIEVQAQEKTDAIKAELREVSQRVRQLDWQNSKMESTVEAIKLDTSGLRQGQDHIRGMQAGTDVKLLAEGELQNKLQMMATSVYSVRAAVSSLKEDFAVVKTNISKLSNVTNQMAGLSGQLLTKQYFTNAILDWKQSTAMPAQAIPQAIITSISNLQHDEPRSEALPHDCWQVQQQGHNTSGIYRIKPILATVPFFVYCQMETHGGGWTMIQNRYEGTVDFYREWQDYKNGFGNIGGEFWLGLEKIHSLTNHKVTELMIELQDFTLEKTYAHYTAFAVGTEIEGYPISFLGSYEGDAGDSLVYHAGMKFSTFDMDHDNWHDGNCAESHTGAWWYNGCDTSNLNGRYLNGDLPEPFEYQGMYWYDWHGPGYSLMKSRISVRPSEHSYSHIKLSEIKPAANKTSKSSEKKKKNNVTTPLKATELPPALGVEDSPPVGYPPYDNYDFPN